MATGVLFAAPTMMQLDLREDIAAIDQLTAELSHGNLARAAKVASADTTLNHGAAAR
jgi:hypothetical protein